MARKTRDHKAEYAASKRRATVSGYKSQREYKAVRKELKLPKRAMPITRKILAASAPEKLNDAAPHARQMARLRKESAAWSKKHSRVSRSRYTKRLTDEQTKAYHRAYVEPLPGNRQAEKRKRIFDWLDSIDDVKPEWEGKYPKS